MKLATAHKKMTLLFQAAFLSSHISNLQHKKHFVLCFTFNYSQVTQSPIETSCRSKN